MRKAMIFLAGIYLAWTSVLATGVTVVRLEDKDLSSGETEEGTMYLASKMLRLESVGSLGSKTANSVIYRGDRELVWFLDHDQKQYTQMDKATMDRMASRMDEAMRRVKEQLEKFPPEQREMMESIMKQQTPKMAKQSPPLTVKQTSERENIEGYSCLKYELFRGDEKSSEVWATGWRELGLNGEVFGVFKDMSAFFEKLASSLAQNPLFEQGNQPFSGFE